MIKLFSVLISLHLILFPVQYAHAGDAAKTGQYAKMIISLAQSIIGSSILIKCKSAQPSLAIFMAGSIASVGNEVYEALERAFKHQDETADMGAEIKEPGPDATPADLENYQKEISNQQIKAQEKMKADAERDVKTFKRKEVIAWAIFGVYGVAAIVAAIEAWMSLPTPYGANKDASGNCSGSDGGSSTKALTNAVLIAYKLSSVLQTVAGGVNAIASKNWLSLGSVAISAGPQYKMLSQMLGKTTEASEKSVPKLMDNVWVRLATFAVFATLAGFVAKGIGAEKDAAQKRADDLQKVIDEMKGTKSTLATTPGGPAATGPQDSGIKELPKLGNIKKLATGKAPKNCFSHGGGGVELSEAGCARPIKFKKLDFAQFKLNSSTLTQGANLATDMGNAMASGDMAKFDETASGMAAMAGKIKEMQDDVIGKLNTARVSAKEKPIDVNKEAAAIMASMQADYDKAAGSLGGGSGLANASDPKDEEVKPAETQVTTAAVPAAALPPEVAVPDVNLDSESGIEDASLAGAGKAEQSLDDFESTEQDISKKSDVSIFKQLSNRYILNYTKMFDRRKTPQVVEEPAKN